MILEKIHQQTARLVQSMKKIHIIGKQLSWVLMTLLMLEVSFSWIFISQQTIHLNQPKLLLRPGCIILTSTQMAQFVWIFLRNNGHQHLLSQKFCSQSVHYWQILIQMIHLYLILHIYTNMTDKSMMLMLESGQGNMQCEWRLRSYTNRYFISNYIK